MRQRAEKTTIGFDSYSLMVQSNHITDKGEGSSVLERTTEIVLGEDNGQPNGDRGDIPMEIQFLNDEGPCPKLYGSSLIRFGAINLPDLSLLNSQLISPQAQNLSLVNTHLALGVQDIPILVISTT